jgi:hypothetical protein
VFTIKRFTLTSLLLLLALTVPATSLAAQPKSGKWKGHWTYRSGPSDGFSFPLSFTVRKSKVTDVHFKIPLYCGDGYVIYPSSISQAFGSDLEKPGKVDAAGRFEARGSKTVIYADALLYKYYTLFFGRFKKPRKASGGILAHSLVGPSAAIPQPDQCPHGFDSGKVTWKAKHR